MPDLNFTSLISYLGKIPSVDLPISSDTSEDGLWSVKFQIDIEHPLAWRVVQEVGHVVNALSLHEKLPALFYPVSPPPYMNGGPKEFLSWVIVSNSADFTPDLLREWLEGRLPTPVENLDEWNSEDEDE